MVLLTKFGQNRSNSFGATGRLPEEEEETVAIQNLSRFSTKVRRNLPDTGPYSRTNKVRKKKQLEYNTLVDFRLR